MTDMNRQEQFLIEEYKSAVQLTYHIDQLRNQLTSFFLTFAGLAVAGMLVLLKGEANKGFMLRPEKPVAFLLLLVAAIGGLFVAVLARLRKAQIEHFGIINNIRTCFLGDDLALWNVVILSAPTIPKPSHRSGTYFWLATIMLGGSSILGMGAYLLVDNKLWGLGDGWIALIAAVVWLVAQDRAYFCLAKSTSRTPYDAGNLPF